jgi:catechol 2,3-dioxygenase-like lactoylglutathione lyase family enzyme
MDPEQAGSQAGGMLGALACSVHPGSQGAYNRRAGELSGGRRSYGPSMAVRRIVAYAGGDEVAASRDFYVEVLGMQVAMEDPVLDLHSPDDPSGEIVIGAQEMQDPQPSFGVDVGEPAAVDAAHAEALRRGLRVVYPLTDEPWGVRRFFVEDPGGTIVNVLAHIA